MPLKVTLNKFPVSLDDSRKEIFTDITSVVSTDEGVNVGVRSFVHDGKILYVNKEAFESILIEKV